MYCILCVTRLDSYLLLSFRNVRIYLVSFTCTVRFMTTLKDYLIIILSNRYRDMYVR